MQLTRHQVVTDGKQTESLRRIAAALERIADAMERVDNDTLHREADEKADR